MKTLSQLKRSLSHLLFPIKETAPEQAYDLWADAYDAQPDNLMLALDETLFSELLTGTSFKELVIADVGCGTGRHWTKIYAGAPRMLKGYDVSQGMLDVLKQKFPQAETHQLTSNTLVSLAGSSCDLILTTLAMAHIPDIGDAFKEWARVLKPGGRIILTDYHPDTLSKGGNRTFTHAGKTIAVKNYIHPISKIRTLFNALHLSEDRFEEKRIDQRVKHYYEKQNALHVYNRFKDTAMIYGMCLTKSHAAL